MMNPSWVYPTIATAWPLSARPCRWMIGRSSSRLVPAESTYLMVVRIGPGSPQPSWTISVTYRMPTSARAACMSRTSRWTTR
jgi:hypothetical protein